MKDVTTAIGNQWLLKVACLGLLLVGFDCRSISNREIPCSDYLGHSIREGKMEMVLLVPADDGLKTRLAYFLQKNLARPITVSLLNRAQICDEDVTCKNSRFPSYRKKSHPSPGYAAFLQAAYVKSYTKTGTGPILLHVEYTKKLGRLNGFELYIYIPRVVSPPSSFCRKESLVYGKNLTIAEAAIIIGNRIEALTAGEKSNEELKGRLLELEKTSGCLGGFSL